MSLTPSTAKCDSECLDFTKIGEKRKGSNLESYKISNPRLAYSVGETVAHLEGLPTVLRRLSKNRKLRLVRVNDGVQVPIESALYYGQFGVVEISSGKLRIITEWKRFIITLSGSDSHSVHLASKDHIPGTNDYALSHNCSHIEISVYKKYHGPERKLDEIPEMMQHNYSAASTVVVYKPQNAAPGVYNAAYVNKTDWICTVCEKAFKTPSLWATHFPVAVELPHMGSWYKVNIEEGHVRKSHVPFRPQISKPIEFHHQYTFNDSAYLNTSRFWKQLIRSFTRTKLLCPDVDIPPIDVSVTEPSEETCGHLLLRIVTLARSQWEKDLKRWCEYERHSVHGWTRLPYHESQRRQGLIAAIRKKFITRYR